jgi:hypothetical protein
MISLWSRAVSKKLIKNPAGHISEFLQKQHLITGDPLVLNLSGAARK